MFTRRVFLGAGPAMLSFPLFPSRGNAALPPEIKVDKQLEEKQYGYVTVTPREPNKVLVAVKFSNGKQLDGDHYVALIEVLNRGGDPIAAQRVTAGVSASFGGPTTEVTENTTITIPDDKVGEVSEYRVSIFFWDAQKDSEVLRRLAKIGATFANNPAEGFEMLLFPKP